MKQMEQILVIDQSTEQMQGANSDLSRRDDGDYKSGFSITRPNPSRNEHLHTFTIYT